MVIHLLLVADGLVQRFGHLVPGAVALCASVERLNARLERGPTPDKVELHAVRLTLGPPDSGTAETMRFELQSMGGLPGRPRTHLLKGFENLRPQLHLGPEAVCLVLTATQKDFNAAWAADLDTYRLGFETAAQPSRALEFDDVQRILEEKLHIPTARPMSRVARTGGLLAIPCDDPADARRQALEAMAEDAHADWTLLGSTLILYTEEPDYEDRLAARPGVERLSYGVQKDGLSLILGEKLVSDKKLYSSEGFVLTENPSAGSESLTWNTVRRRQWSQRVEKALPSMEELIQQVEKPFAMPPVQGDVNGALAELVGPKACFDLWKESEKTLAVAWQAPGEVSASSDALVVLVHRVADLHDTENLSNALALWRSGASGKLGDTLHCVVLSSGAPVEALIRAFLLPEERHRARVIEG